MKKLVFPRYSIISLSIVALLVSAWCVCAHITRGETELYTGLPFLTTDDIKFRVAMAILILFLSAVLVFLSKNLKIKWLFRAITLATVTASAFVVLYLVAGILGFAPKSYVELTSDDGQHHIVIAEDCYPFSIYGGDVYEKTSFCTMEYLTKYETQIDDFTPFSDGDYSVTWGEESFELFYDSDGDGELDRKITVEYLD